MKFIPTIRRVAFGLLMAAVFATGDAASAQPPIVPPAPPVPGDAPLAAEETAPAPPMEADEQLYEARIADLIDRLDAAEERIAEIESRKESKDSRPDSSTSFNWPCLDDDCAAEGNGGNGRHKSSYYVDYDKGFVIRPYDKKKDPYELIINGRLQFRHTAFARDRHFYVNNTGPIGISNENYFELERARLSFGGFFLDPNLGYYINFDADTDDEHMVIAHDWWFNYEFCEAFNLHVGKAFVPGSRQWIDGSTSTRFADRSLATTFFRPDRSPGVWALGDIGDFHYYTMISNGLQASDLMVPGQIDDQFAFASSQWWDPLGDFGKGYSDLEWHNDPVVRIGHSMAFANQKNNEFTDMPLTEQAYVRLSEGSRLTALGALAPGIQVHDFETYLYAVDGAFKYRGLSADAEVYFRWIEDLSVGGGPSPVDDLYQFGYVIEGGYMIIPETLEANLRASTVEGMFKTTWEYAIGVNYFIDGTHGNKLTFDVTTIDGSPVGNSGPNYRVGDDGVMFRTQWQASF